MAIITKEISDKYALYNGDCIDVMKDIPDNKVDLGVYSPPFADLYTFSSDIRDISNCDSYEDFIEHYRYVVKDMHRITKKGRFNCIHCCDIPSPNGAKMIDLSGHIIKLHDEEGFDFVARHVIWREPLWVRNKTMLRSLTHKTIVTDASKAGVAGADYMLVFRKRGENETPIQNPTGFSHYAGLEKIPEDLKNYAGWTGDQKVNRLSHWIWQRYASSVWDDIDMSRLMPYTASKEEDDEKHVTPTHMDIIDRVIQMRSNPNEIVFTPFLGVGTEAYCAVKLGRHAIGVELKESYFKQAVKNMEIGSSNIVSDRAQTTMDFGLDL